MKKAKSAILFIGIIWSAISHAAIDPKACKGSDEKGRTLFVENNWVVNAESSNDAVEEAQKIISKADGFTIKERFGGPTLWGEDAPGGGLVIEFNPKKFKKLEEAEKAKNKTLSQVKAVTGVSVNCVSRVVSD